MELHDILLLTDDVRKLSAFYRAVLGIEGVREDVSHQILLHRGIPFAVQQERPDSGSRHIAMAFTVEDLEDMDAAYRRAYALGAIILQPPTVDPFGAVSMIFLDPDGNRISIHCMPQKANSTHA